MKTSSARPRPRRLGRSEPLKWRVSDAMWERLAPILTTRRAASATRARPLRPPPVPGGDPLRALHRHALAAGALPRARPPERRDLPPPLEEWSQRGLLSAGDPRPARAAGRGQQARLVAGDRRCLAGRGKKGGEKVARTLRGSPGSRFHLAVDAGGLPLAIALSAGNENERRYLLPLLERLAAAGIHPRELWADRGYASRAHERALAERRIRSRISQPRRPGQPIPPGQASYEVWRGKKRRLKTHDPRPPSLPGRAHERLAEGETPDRHPPRPQADNYLAFLELG